MNIRADEENGIATGMGKLTIGNVWRYVEVKLYGDRGKSKNGY